MNKVLASFLASLLCITSAHAVTQAATVPQSQFLSATPVVEVRDGKILSISNRTRRTEYRYDNGYLKAIRNSDGSETRFYYNARGELAYVLLADGTVHEAQYDRTGNLATLTSSRGATLQLSIQPVGKTKTRTALKKGPRAEPSIAPGKAALAALDAVPANPADPSLARTLIIAEGWEENIPEPMDCEDAQRSPGPLAAEEDYTPACAVVVIVGDRPGGDDGGFYFGNFWGRGAPGGSGGGGSRGPQPGDSLEKQICYAQARRAWHVMDDYVCKHVIEPHNKRACYSVNFDLYEAEVARCQAMP